MWYLTLSMGVRENPENQRVAKNKKSLKKKLWKRLGLY